MVTCPHVCFILQSNKLDKPDKQEVSDNVKVVVRCRPLNQKEKMMSHKQAVTVDEIRGTITVNRLETPQEPPKTFTFDTVFGQDSKQLDVYNLTARPIIDSVLEGYNGTQNLSNQFFEYNNILALSLTNTCRNNLYPLWYWSATVHRGFLKVYFYVFWLLHYNTY